MIDSVPLIQNPNDAQQINASIIAMKKASRELDEKIVKLNSLNSELDKKIALLDSGLNKEIEDRKEAINSLDVASVGGSGKYISAISETDGKISATASDITSSVSSGNSQPVTSGGVADAINKIELVNNADTNTCYPSENNKIGYYQGIFTSNVPDTHTPQAILTSVRTLREDTSYTEIYQEYEVYGYSSIGNYAPIIYTRYGYYESGTPVWSSWTKIVKDLDVVNTIARGNNNPITSNAVANVIGGHFLELDSPNNTVTYVKVGIRNYVKSNDSVFITFNCYSMWGVIRETSQCFYRGTKYGVIGVSYTTYLEDSNAFFWISFTNYRTIAFISSKELYVIERTTTAPSGITFTEPVQWT